MTRLYFYVVIAFATSFVAVAWAARGFPMHSYGPVSISSLQPTVTSTFADQNAREDERRSGRADTPQTDRRSAQRKISGGRQREAATIRHESVRHAVGQPMQRR